MVTVLVAGPADRNTNAAPADTPESIRPAAIGREAVAHTYIGTAITMTIRYESHEYSMRISARLEGIATVINAPRSRPQNSGLAISPKRVINAYFRAFERKKPFLFVVLELQHVGFWAEQQLGFSCDWGERENFVAEKSVFLALGFISLSKIFVKIPAIIAIIMDVTAL